MEVFDKGAIIALPMVLKVLLPQNTWYMKMEPWPKLMKD
jgi:hypothetical protein